MALAGCFGNRCAGIGTRKLRNLGSDLGGAVRGFKEGMKGAEEENAPSSSTQQVTSHSVKSEVEEKEQPRI